MEIFLVKVKEVFPESNPEKAWQEAIESISQKYCQIVRVLDNTGICGLELTGGKCPYHRDTAYDFWRRCDFTNTNGMRCHHQIRTRDLSEKWCIQHINVPKSNVFISRAGEFVVIKDTPYALSDDMLSIIGRVVADYDLKFYLKREVDDKMATMAKNYGLSIRLDEEN